MKTDLVVTAYIFNNNKVLLTLHTKLNIWIGVGGHIEPNETPDDALIREAKEETNLDIEILGQTTISKAGNVVRNLANPFYVNVHSVGDHHHCSFFYVCRALNPDQLKINHEAQDFRWFSKEELGEDIIPVDVRHQALRAFEVIEKKVS